MWQIFFQASFFAICCLVLFVFLGNRNVGKYTSSSSHILHHHSSLRTRSMHCTENLIYVFTEMKLRRLVPNSYIHVSSVVEP